MKEVTDPELLRQLNAPDAPESKSGSEGSRGKEVTDPKLLAMLNEDDTPEKTAPSKMPRPTLPSLKELGNEGWWSFLGMKSPIREGTNAMAQSLVNTGIGVADLVPGVNIKPVTDWSTGDSALAKVGGLTGDLLGFSAGAGGVSAASKLPKVEAGLKNLYSMIPEFSHKAAIAEKLSSPLAKTVAGNAAFGAVLDPEHQLEGAGTGALLGAAGHGAGKLLGTSDPALKAAGGGLIGAALGYPVGEITGIGGAHGAEAGMAIGAGATLWPSSGKRAIANVLGNANPQEMGTRRQNAKDLGYTHQTPAEATGNPFDIGIESKIGESKQGLVPLWKYKKEGAAEQKKIIGDFVDDVSPAMDAAEEVRDAAKKIQSGKEDFIRKSDQNKIDDLLDSIHPDRTDASLSVREAAKSYIKKEKDALSDRASPVYKSAGKDEIPDADLNDLLNDKRIKIAFKDVLKDPDYSQAFSRKPMSGKQTISMVSDRIDSLLRDANKKTNNQERIQHLMDAKKNLTKDPGNPVVQSVMKELKSDPIFNARIQGINPNSIEFLDAVKKAINDVESGVLSQDNKRYKASLIKGSRKKLVEKMDWHSPGYTEARKIYGEGAQPIKDLENSYLGKIASLKDTDLKRVTSTIFDRNQTNISDFNAIQSQISRENPETWKRIVRNSIEDRLSKIKSGDPSAAFSDNIFGSKKDLEQIYNATKGMPDIQKRILSLKDEFKSSSEKMSSIRKTLVSKISKMGDAQLKNVSGSIFDPKQTDITKFKEIRDAIYKENPKAWRGIIRNEIERRLAPTDGGGSDFYKQILKNQNSYDQMVEATKVLGGNSSKKLAQMRDVFETLIDPKTGKAIYDEARIGGASIKPGGILHQLVKFGDGVINGRYNKAATELITNPKWDEESSKIALVKNKEERAMRYAKLMARIANAELND